MAHQSTAERRVTKPGVEVTHRISHQASGHEAIGPQSLLPLQFKVLPLPLLHARGQRRYIAQQSPTVQAQNSSSNTPGSQPHKVVMDAEE